MVSLATLKTTASLFKYGNASQSDILAR